MKKIVFVLSFVFATGLTVSTFANQVIIDNGTKICTIDDNNDKKPCPADCKKACCANKDAKTETKTDAKCETKAQSKCCSKAKAANCDKAKDGEKKDTKSENTPKKE